MASMPAEGGGEPQSKPPTSSSQASLAPSHTPPDTAPSSSLSPPKPRRIDGGLVSTSPLSQRSIFKSGEAAPTPAPDVATSPRNALFDDHVASAHVPGSLHLAPDSTIERLVERQGVVPLIRQLAEDLAHRDRELVNFRRRAEERERALRKMLVEAEISNADIEKRLTTATVQRKASRETLADGPMSYTESIDEMMQQAMSEEDAFSVRDEGSVMDDNESFAESLFVPRRSVRDLDSISLNSNASSAKGSAARGWKGFFWGQKNHGAVEEETVKDRRVPSASGGSIKRKPIPPELIGSLPDDLHLPHNASRTSLASVGGVASRRPPQPSVIHTNWDPSQPRPSHFKAVGLAADSLSQQSAESLVQRRTSSSVANWALRLVTQAPPAQGQENVFDGIPPTSPSRPRSRSTPDGSIDGNKRRSSLGTSENLQKVTARNVVQRQQAKTRSRAPSTSGPSAPQPAKSSKFFQDIKDTAGRIVPMGDSSQAAAVSSKPTDSGPVEMDMIIPHAVQPPTLLQSWNQYYPTEYLTDRFGFIYDKRRGSVAVKGIVSIGGSYTERKHPEEMVKLDTEVVRERVSPSSRPVTPKKKPETPFDTASTKTPTRWQDVANMTSSPTDTDSHPPSAALHHKPSPDGIGRHEIPTTALIERLSRPGATITSPASTSTTNAFSEAPLTLRPQPSTDAAATSSSAEEATVRLLLGQLSDLHDSLQRDRSVKWNEFLRKIRSERRRGEEEEKGMPEVTLSDGELIGIATLGTEGRGGKQRWKEFKALVLGGIPVSYRWKIWTECSGATSMKVPGYYDDLLANIDNNSDPLVISQIAMDINRTLTDNIFFRKGPGVSKLKQVLLAYSRRNKDVGYCQGMNMIAASLLLIMPSEEDAFWVLCSVVERILPKTYFEPNLLASRADQQVLKYYVATILPSLHTHLLALGVELEALTFQWFLSIFTDTLAAEALFRVWDVILCVAGSTFLFQVAVALLRLNEKSLLHCGSAAEVYSYLNGGVIHQGISIDGLIRESDALKGLIKRKEVEKRREAAVKRELRERGESEDEHEMARDEEGRVREEDGRERRQAYMHEIDEDGPAEELRAAMEEVSPGTTMGTTMGEVSPGTTTAETSVASLVPLTPETPLDTSTTPPPPPSTAITV
ncbi:rab-GTPase-TBC domain-containing protein [Geopyxis carbonaria]|nr:rab-GTPase-TBC domain-containing protein [Geopyxis carbonaria]